MICVLEVAEAHKRGIKIPDKIMDFLWDCKFSLCSTPQSLQETKSDNQTKWTDLSASIPAFIQKIYRYFGETGHSLSFNIFDSHQR